MSKLKAAVAVIFAVLLFSLPLPVLAAQPAQIHFELGFGWTFVGPAFKSTYVNQFAPPLTPASYYISSSASQTISMKGKTTYGINGFFHLFFNKNLGLQLLADYHRPGFHGKNSAYHLILNYQTTAPARYEKIDNDWPDTSGDFIQTSFSLNVIGRFKIASNLSLSVSAGPSLFYIQGKAVPLGFTSFQMTYDGSSYVLTGKTYKMVFEFGPESRYGFNVGTEAAYTIYRNIILAIDVRWFQASKVNSKLKIAASDVITEPIEQIEQMLNLGSIRVNPSYFRSGLAVRFNF